MKFRPRLFSTIEIATPKNDLIMEISNCFQLGNFKIFHSDHIFLFVNGPFSSISLRFSLRTYVCMSEAAVLLIFIVTFQIYIFSIIIQQPQLITFEKHERFIRTIWFEIVSKI